MAAETKVFLCLKDNYGVLVHDPASGATAERRNQPLWIGGTNRASLQSIGVNQASRIRFMICERE